MDDSKQGQVLLSVDSISHMPDAKWVPLRGHSVLDKDTKKDLGMLFVILQVGAPGRLHLLTPLTEVLVPLWCAQPRGCNPRDVDDDDGPWWVLVKAVLAVRRLVVVTHLDVGRKREQLLKGTRQPGARQTQAPTAATYLLVSVQTMPWPAGSPCFSALASSPIEAMKIAKAKTPGIRVSSRPSF